MFYSTMLPSPVGVLTLASDGDCLVGLWLAGQKYHGGTLHGPMAEKNDVPVFGMARRWLERYFAGEKPDISELPLAPIGGAFRQGVWGMLREIPYGALVTYGGLAARMAEKMRAKSMSSQAVGGAVGHNPISIIIPCHRVVGANGSVTGYAGGVAAKLKLLELEGIDTSALSIPKTGTAL